MIIILFFGSVFGLLAAAGGLGFLTALYVVRHDLFAELVRLLGAEPSLVAKIAAGLTLAVVGPIVGGLAYAASAASSMTAFFGSLGTWFCAWVGGTDLRGLVLALLLRHLPNEANPQVSTRGGPHGR
jgi:hypothetical protein